MTQFAVMNGDPRNVRLCGLLCEDGHKARLFESHEVEEAVSWGRVVVLPIKGMEPGLFNGFLAKGQTLVTGEDFLTREDFAILNAIPTAEGAVEIAMEVMPITLHGSQVLVIGYGRIGKYLCKLLHGLGARVAASARKEEDMAWITALGYEKLHTMRLEGQLGRFDAIFNTVPHMTLPYALLLELKSDCLIVDLASSPGGVDFKAADNLGLVCRWALSLPGKCAPISAARYMKSTLYRILEERGVAL